MSYAIIQLVLHDYREIIRTQVVLKTHYFLGLFLNNWIVSDEWCNLISVELIDFVYINTPKRGQSMKIRENFQNAKMARYIKRNNAIGCKFEEKKII